MTETKTMEEELRALIDEFMAEHCGEGRGIIGVSDVTDFLLDARLLLDSAS